MIILIKKLWEVLYFLETEVQEWRCFFSSSRHLDGGSRGLLLLCTSYWCSGCIIKYNGIEILIYSLLCFSFGPERCLTLGNGPTLNMNWSVFVIQPWEHPEIFIVTYLFTRIVTQLENTFAHMHEVKRPMQTHIS